MLAAEVLQVRSSSLLQIGDRNRSFTVKLSCFEPYPSKETEASEWLKSELPRYRKVNFMPQGSMEGLLVARVITVGKKIDISQKLASKGFGEFNCQT